MLLVWKFPFKHSFEPRYNVLPEKRLWALTLLCSLGALAILNQLNISLDIWPTQVVWILPSNLYEDQLIVRNSQQGHSPLWYNTEAQEFCTDSLTGWVIRVSFRGLIVKETSVPISCLIRGTSFVPVLHAQFIKPLLLAKRDQPPGDSYSHKFSLINLVSWSVVNLALDFSYFLPCLVMLIPVNILYQV